MITEDYVSFDTAKFLNSKGFKGEFHKHYWGYEPGKEFLTDGSFNPEYDYPAPTLQTATKWLREVHNIAIGITFRRPHRILWEIYKNEDFIIGADSSLSYEDVCDEAIKCALNLI